MAVFNIAAGQTLRMDKLLGSVPTAVGALIVENDGSLSWTMTNQTTNPQTLLYALDSMGSVLTLPFGNETMYPVHSSGIGYAIGDLSISLTFFDPAAGAVVGTLTGQVWHDVALIENAGPDGSGGTTYTYDLSFEDDIIFGGDDIVTLGAGDDVFYDYGGKLTASLGAGDDEAHLYSPIQFDTDFRSVNAGDGDDQIYYQSGTGKIMGGAGNDSIGGEGNNDGNWTLNGGEGRDVILAYNASRIVDNRGSGSDDYSGTAYWGAIHPVTVSYATGNLGITVDLFLGQASGGGHGTDTLNNINRVEGTQGADMMSGWQFFLGPFFAGTAFWGNKGNDTITGGDADDTLYGGADDDVITGLSGNDRLFGDDGDDRLRGDWGADTLRGDLGADDFIYARETDSTLTRDGRDRIVGFEAGVDDIDLTALGLGAFTFVGTAGFSAARQVRYEYIGTDTVVFVNTTGKYTAEMRIDLAGTHVLTAGDFI